MSAALEAMDEDDLEVLYERTQSVVQAVDVDGDGSVDAKELTAFFEKLQSVSSDADADPPEEEAMTIIEGAGDGESVDLDELTEILMETFVEDMDVLDAIEELLEAEIEEKEDAVEAGLASAWRVDRSADVAAGGEAEPVAESVEAEACGEEMIAACHELTDQVMEHVDSTVDPEVESAIRDFFSTLRLTLKRRKRRLKRTVGRMAEERQIKLMEQHATYETDAALGRQLLADAADEEAALAFVQRNPLKPPTGGAYQWISDIERQMQIEGMGSIETSTELCLKPLVSGAANAACEPACLSVLAAALEKLGSSVESGRVPLESFEDLCAVLQEYPAAKIASVPSFAPNAAAALKAVVSRSEGSSFIDVLAEEGMLGLLLDWLKNLEKRDDVVASVCGLLVDICKLSADALALFMEQDGFEICLAALRPGRSVDAMSHATRLIGVAAASTDELVSDLVMEQLFESDDDEGGPPSAPAESEPAGIERVLAALNSTTDPSFQETACKTLYYIAANEDFIDNWLAEGLQVLTAVLEASAEEESAQVAEAAGIVFLKLVRSEQVEVKKKVARYLATHALDTLGKILETHQGSAPMLRTFLALVGKIALLPDIKEAMMNGGFIERAIMLMKLHVDDVDVQEHGANALCGMSKQQPTVKEYIVANLGNCNPFEAIIAAMRKFSASPTLVKAAAAALWSIAFKSVDLKAAAGSSGAFLLLSQAARMHRTDVKVLPHVFIAASNLCVNSASNQKEAYRGGIINICVELAQRHLENATVTYAVLNCLNSLTGGNLDGQVSNHTKLEECGGLELLDEIEETHDNAKLIGLVEKIRGAVEDGKELAKEELIENMGGKLSLLEEEELQEGDPWLFVDDESRNKALRQRELRVKHKKGRATTTQLVILYKHNILFLERTAGSNKQVVVDQYYLSLMSEPKIDDKDPKLLKFFAVHMGEKMSVGITCDGRIDAEEWLAVLLPLMPTKCEMIGATLGKEKAIRFASWQAECLFLFNVSKDKRKNYRLAKTFPATKATVDDCSLYGYKGKEEPYIALTEIASGRAFRYVHEKSSKKPLSEWGEFLASEFARIASSKQSAVLAKKAKTKKLFGKIKLSAQLSSGFNHAVEAGRAKSLAQLQEQRRLEDEEDERLDALELAEESSKQEEAKLSELAAKKVAIEERKRKQAARQDTASLTAEIDSMKEEELALKLQVLKASAARKALEEELAGEEEVTEAKLQHVDSMVEELRRLTGDKLPEWLVAELSNELGRRKPKGGAAETREEKADAEEREAIAKAALEED